MDPLVMVGASTGGVRALATLASGLPADFAAPIVVVQHVGAHRSILPEILSQAGPLPAVHAGEAQRLEAGTIYVAPADCHVLVHGDTLQLNRGAKHHHTRPAIDRLLVYAALARGPRAIGVLLTGRLDDGTTGLPAIKACGGVVVVQDPLDAEAPDMPTSALRHVEVDHCVTLSRMAPLLASLAGADKATVADAGDRPPDALIHERALLLGKGNPMEHLSALGEPSPYACPDCHGGLWEVRDVKPRRFRCRTGHGFTIRTLQDTLAAAAEKSLWNVRRALQKRLILLRDMDGPPRADLVAPMALDGAASRLERQLGDREPEGARPRSGRVARRLAARRMPPEANTQPGTAPGARPFLRIRTFAHNKRLQYTIRVASCNPGLANLMLKQSAGPTASLPRPCVTSAST